MDAFSDFLPAWSAVEAFGSTSSTVSQPAMRPTMAWHIDCTTGRPVARWVILPAADSQGGRVTETAASYA